MIIFLNKRKVLNLKILSLKLIINQIEIWTKELAQVILILYQWIQIFIKKWIKTIEKYLRLILILLIIKPINHIATEINLLIKLIIK